MTARSRTKAASQSAISTTKFKSAETISALATIRFTGEHLVPDQITQILQIRPTQAYKKGEIYAAGPRSPQLKGRTGVWYFSTDTVLASRQIEDHVACLIGLLLPAPDKIERLAEVKRLIAKRGLKAHVTLFWHGRHKAKKPTIPPIIPEFFKILPADVELDFEVEEEPAKHHVA